MTCDVRIQPSALRELEGIVAYLNSLDRQAARSFVTDWQSALETLRDEIVEFRLSRFDVLALLGYRTMLVANYVVLYFKDDYTATIAHIFHQSQDYASLILGENNEDPAC